MNAPRTTFLVAAALHAGFQITVTALVYPALARVHTQNWRSEHDLHSRRIVPLVGVVYLFLACSTVWLLVVDRGPWTWAAAVVSAAVAAVTAFAAAPLHGALATHNPTLIRRLLVIDWIRTALALLLLGTGIGVMVS